MITALTTVSIIDDNKYFIENAPPAADVIQPRVTITNPDHIRICAKPVQFISTH